MGEQPEFLLVEAGLDAENARASLGGSGELTAAQQSRLQAAAATEVLPRRRATAAVGTHAFGYGIADDGNDRRIVLAVLPDGDIAGRAEGTRRPGRVERRRIPPDRKIAGRA